MSNEMNGQPIDFKFLVAGRAEFTVFRKETNVEYTFRVKSGKNPNMLWVQLLAGPNNMADFVYLGAFYLSENKLKPTQASQLKGDSQPFVVFNYVADRLLRASKNGVAKNDVFKHGVEVLHVGKCAHCGRKLTDAESIESGFGPICDGRPARSKKKNTGVKKRASKTENTSEQV